MPRQSREAVQDAALVQLLRALPDERLEGILEALGVKDRDRGRRRDHRYCRTCGRSWLGHKALTDLEGDDPHAWDSA